MKEQTKQQVNQIEEIRELMRLLDKCVSLNPMCKAEVANVVYGNNYRKIPEDSVVILNEEYNRYLNLKDLLDSGCEKMTDKEKIEQMASDVENALHNHCRMLISCSCNDCEFLKYRTPKTDCQAMCIAKNLYNKNYQKIEDDCVVITKDELKQHKEQAVKEFAEKVKMLFYYEFDELIPSIMSDKIDELLKEYEK